MVLVLPNLARALHSLKLPFLILVRRLPPPPPPDLFLLQARYAERHFDRVCAELNTERRHLKFALGKLSQLQKETEPLQRLI